MELGIIADEVHADFERACARIREWNLPWVEVRNVGGTNVTLLDDDAVGRAADVVRAAGLRVSAVASPVFKSNLDESPPADGIDFAVPGVETVDAQLELLDRACAIANRFDTKLVRIFSFLRLPAADDEVLDLVASRVVRAAEVAARHDVVLAVENEPACIVGTGAELGRFFERFDAVAPERARNHVAALWDPGNALGLGETPYPDGYRSVPKDRLAHVHLKDLGADPAAFGTFVPIGQGRVDYDGQFAALLRDGYAGPVVLEPHYAPEGVPSDEAARVCVEAARESIARATGA